MDDKKLHDEVKIIARARKIKSTYEEIEVDEDIQKASHDAIASILKDFPVYEIHELGNIFPMPRDEDIDELAELIQYFGLQKPITLFEGKILDGKCRYEACKLALVIPVFTTFPDDFPDFTGGPLEYVLKVNRNRANFTQKQKILLAQKFSKYIGR
jgi:hypothetical protein